MTRGRFVAGIAAGVWLLLCAAAHSLLGWRALAAELRKRGAGEELVRSLAIGWHFGGAALVAFGCIVLVGVTAAKRGAPSALLAPRIVGAICFAFGLAAMVATGGELFFLVFVLPGALLFYAAGSPRAGAHS